MSNLDGEQQAVRALRIVLKDLDDARAEVERLRADADARAVEELHRVQQWAKANSVEMLYHGPEFASTHMAVSCAQVKIMVEDRIAELSKPAAKESEPVNGEDYVRRAFGELNPSEFGHTKPEEPDWTVTLAAQAKNSYARTEDPAEDVTERLLAMIVEGLCHLGREVRK